MASQYSCVYLSKREDGFMVHRGLAEKDGSIVIQMSGRKIIVVDRERKAFLRLFIIDYLKERMTVDVKRKNLSAIEHNQILDQTDEGERWEGDVWNDQPYGWGVLYDKDSNIAIRDGRMVIPVPAAFKRKLNGIVHDESTTGKTSYIEPAEIIETIYEIREVQLVEQREISRLLRQFADDLRPYIYDLIPAYDDLKIFRKSCLLQILFYNRACR